MTPDEQQIHALHSTWIDAVNASDLARLLALMAEDAVFLNPGKAPLGRDGFSSNFLAASQQFRVRCTSELEEVIVVGDFAFTRSRDALSVTNRNGEEETHFAGHRMTIYRRHPQTGWLLARDAHTLSPVS